MLPCDLNCHCTANVFTLAAESWLALAAVHVARELNASWPANDHGTGVVCAKLMELPKKKTAQYAAGNSEFFNVRDFIDMLPLRSTLFCVAQDHKRTALEALRGLICVEKSMLPFALGAASRFPQVAA